MRAVFDTLIAAAEYLALTFAAGFVFGVVRVLWLAPRVGERAAELIEAPLMLLVIVLAARRVTRRVPPSRARRLAVGLVALGFLLAVETVAALSLRGLTLAAYVASRDPVSGGGYLVLLGLFAIMPLLIPPASRPATGGS